MTPFNKPGGMFGYYEKFATAEPETAQTATTFGGYYGVGETEPEPDPFDKYQLATDPEPSPFMPPDKPGGKTFGDTIEKDGLADTEQQRKRDEAAEHWIPYDWAADAARQRRADCLATILEWLTVYAVKDPDFDPATYFAGSEHAACWETVRDDPAVVAATEAAVAGAEKAAARRTAWSHKSRLEDLLGKVQGHPAKIATANTEMARLRAYIVKDLPKTPAGLAFIKSAGNAAYDFLLRGGIVGLVIDKLSNNELPQGTRERTTWIVETYRRMWGAQPTAATLEWLDNGGHKDGLFGGKVPFASRETMTGLILENPPPADFTPVAESVIPEVRRLLVLAKELAQLKREYDNAKKQLERLQLGSHEDLEFQAWFNALKEKPAPPPAGPASGGSGMLILLGVAAKFAGLF